MSEMLMLSNMSIMFICQKYVCYVKKNASGNKKIKRTQIMGLAIANDVPFSGKMRDAWCQLG